MSGDSKADKYKNVYLSLRCNCWEQLKANGTIEVLKEEYPDYYVESAIAGYEVTLELSRENLPKKLGYKKEWTEEEKEAFKPEKEARDAEREAAADKIATHVSCLKRAVIGGPIKSCMNAVMTEKETFKACQIDYRQDESFWVF